MDIDKAVHKHLSPLGHELTLWREAILLLQGRHAKGRITPALGSFIERWLPTETPEPIPSQFDIWLGQEAGGGPLHFAASSLPFANHAGWWALLRLPALRANWAADLRASHFDHLRSLIPGAWLLDPTPLPSGSVIAGLNVSDWSQVDHHRYALRKLDNPAFNHETTAQALQAALVSGRTVLVERKAAIQHWRATYVKDEKGVRLQGVESGPDLLPPP